MSCSLASGHCGKAGTLTSIRVSRAIYRCLEEDPRIPPPRHCPRWPRCREVIRWRQHWLRARYLRPRWLRTTRYRQPDSKQPMSAPPCDLRDSQAQVIARCVGKVLLDSQDTVPSSEWTHAQAIAESARAARGLCGRAWHRTGAGRGAQNGLIPMAAAYAFTVLNTAWAVMRSPARRSPLFTGRNRCARGDDGARDPDIDRGFGPARHRHRAHARAFADQVDDHPAAVALLDVVELQRRRFLAAQAAAEHDGEQRAIAFAFERLACRVR